MASDHNDVAARGPEPEPERDRRLFEILADYFAAVEAGRPPDRSEWLARHPDWAGEIAAFLDEQDRLLRLTEPFRPDGTEGPTSASGPAGGGPGVGFTAEHGPVNGSAGYAMGTRVRYIGDYELLGEIARGGMGIVFRARQRSLNRVVALKMLLADDLASEADDQRLRREAEAAANLDHPNIVPIFEVGRHDGRSYFSMKLVEAGSLAARLAEFADDPRVAARLVAIVARAVNHAHQRGVLHRDLKPGNILLNGGPKTPIGALDPLVTDFGLARRVEGDPGLTQTGAILGTPSYMAPEQAVGKKGTVTVATDVYGLGAVLYALLAGRPPFRGDSALETIARVKDDAIEPPSHRGSRIDRDLETICLKCLEKEPGRRYPSAEAVAEDLERWLDGLPIRVRPTGLIERAWRWCRRNPAAAALAASVGVLLLATTVAVLVVGRAWEVAERLNREVRYRRVATQRQEYARDVKVAGELLEMNRVSEAIEQLARHRPLPGEEDLREFAWRHLWQTAHRAPSPLRGHKGDVYSVAFSPDGRTLATAGQDRTVRLWDVAERRTRLILPHAIDRTGDHRYDINWVSFAPEGRSLATASDDGTVKLWDVSSGRLLSTLSGHADRVVAVLFAPSGGELISCGRDGEVFRWDRATSVALGSFSVRDGSVRGDGTIQSLAISPDGTSLAIAGQRVVVCKLPAGREIFRLEQSSGQFNGVAFSHDGASLATAGEDGAVGLWDARTGRARSALQGHRASVQSVAFAPDGRTLASVGNDGMACLWDATLGAGDAITTGQAGLWCVAFSADGLNFATSSRDATVRLWDSARGRSRIALKETLPFVTSIAFSADGDTLAIANGQCTTWRYDLSGGRLADSRRFGEGLQLHPQLYRSMISRDAAWLAAADHDGSVVIWDTRDGRRIHSLASAWHEPRLVWFAPDRSRLAEAGKQGLITVRDMTTGLEHHFTAGAVKCLEFRPDGGALAFFNVGEQRPALRDFTAARTYPAQGIGHRDEAMALAYSPDGQTLATGGRDRTVILWDGRTMREITRLSGHMGSVEALAFSPCGRTLASGAGDHAVRLWDVASHRELAVLKGHKGPLRHVAFSPDGRTLATCANPFGGDHEVFLWPAAPAE